MAYLLRGGETLIGRLRIRSIDRDPLTTQLRLASLLGSASLRPTGLGPTAILCIRSLSDPLPGKLRIGMKQIRPTPAWEQAVQGALEDRARRAYRPALEMVPSNADAVLFADHAEMLACLARSWLNGDVSSQWWWQSLLSVGFATSGVDSVWLQSSPEHIPAALGLLAAQGQAIEFIRTLPTTTVTQLCYSLSQRFGLLGLASSFDVIFGRRSPILSRQQNEIRDPQDGVAAMTQAKDSLNPALASQNDHIDRLPGPVDPPWESRVPEALDSRLNVEQQCLMGIALLLHRDPSPVRTPLFAMAVLDWVNGRASSPTWTSEFDKTPIQQTKPDPSPSVGQEQVTPLPLDTPAVPVDPGVAQVEDRRQEARLFALPVVPLPVADELRNPRGQVSAADGPATASPQPDIEPFPRLQEATLTTEFGGLFYLINVGIALGLYADFTTPATPGIALDMWDFVALVGLQFLGESLSADPVWDFLTRLAGRGPHEAPGAQFEPPDSWSIPLEWLAPFPDPSIWRWSARGGRLRVLHPQRFLVLDVKQDSNPAQYVRRLVEPYREVAAFQLRRGAIPSRNISPLDTWLGWLMPYLRVRLLRALGRVDDMSGFCFRHQARLYLTPTRLDVALSLAALPVEIRLAGLDRNPGWVPAAGRTITFYFE